MPNLLRYWPPKLGGKRQCLKCGVFGEARQYFPDSSKVRWVDLGKDVREDILSSEGYQPYKEQPGVGDLGLLGCARGVWQGAQYTKEMRKKPWTSVLVASFFPISQE